MCKLGVLWGWGWNSGETAEGFCEILDFSERGWRNLGEEETEREST